MDLPFEVTQILRRSVSGLIYFRQYRRGTECLTQAGQRKRALGESKGGSIGSLHRLATIGAILEC